METTSLTRQEARSAQMHKFVISKIKRAFPRLPLLLHHTRTTVFSLRLFCTCRLEIIHDKNKTLDLMHYEHATLLMISMSHLDLLTYECFLLKLSDLRNKSKKIGHSWNLKEKKVECRFSTKRVLIHGGHWVSKKYPLILKYGFLRLCKID